MTMRRRARMGMKSLMMRYVPGYITCEEADDFVMDYLDGSLPERQRRVFERHIRMCPACKRHLDRQRKVLALVAREGQLSHMPQPAPPEDLVQAILRARGA